MFKKPKEDMPGLFDFLNPFDTKLWLAILGALLATSLLLHIFARYVLTEQSSTIVF